MDSIWATATDIGRVLADGPAFLNNGDDNSWSGAYAARGFDVARGLWAETDTSIHLSGAHCDDLSIELFSIGSNSARLSSWDRLTGDRPGNGSAVEMRYRVGAGAFLGHSVSFAVRPFPAQASLRDGRPVHVLIQRFPDGRCGFALIGRFFASALRRAPRTS